MNDKLKKILSKNSKAKEEIKEEEVEEIPTPEDPLEEEDVDEDEEEEEDETEENANVPEKEDPEIVKSKPKEQISEEELERLKAIDQEIARLRDHGVFNAEILFQVIKVNENLDRIATALESLVK